MNRLGPTLTESEEKAEESGRSTREGATLFEALN